MDGNTLIAVFGGGYLLGMLSAVIAMTFKLGGHE